MIDKYDEDCPGCKPAILDVHTGKVLPKDHPVMVKIMAIWENTPIGHRRAYHRVMCLNSTDPVDRLIVGGIVKQLQESPASNHNIV